jgi:N-acetyl-gamma-glutamyl-phosphate reductase
MKERIQAGIVGGTGYTGVELLRLLAGHPNVDLTLITSRKETGIPVAQYFPSLRGRLDLAFQDPAQAELRTCDVVFFATPHGVAMAQAPALLEAGVRVIDLAADFRLRDPEVFAHWYRMPHSCPGLLPQAVYGLPELQRERVRAARLVGLPGCYPTSVQLGLAPLLELEAARPGTVDCSSLVADCKSGVSGAGRKGEIDYLAAEVDGNFRAYGVAGHRHHPEIVQELSLMAGRPVALTFLPHLVPMNRGIFSTLYVRLLGAGVPDLRARYAARYAGEPFIDLLPEGMWPQTRDVRGTNRVQIALHQPEPGLAVILVAEDNLVKGASGQAVQCMNLMFGLPETRGLDQLAVVP